MANYTATTDMTLEAAITAGSMVNNDELTIEAGATVICDRSPSILMGDLYITEGEFILDGANLGAGDGIQFISNGGSYYSGFNIDNGLGKLSSTLGWYILGTSDGTASQTFTNWHDDYATGCWVETGRRINYDGSVGDVPEVDDWVYLTSDLDVIGRILTVSDNGDGSGYLVVKCLFGAILDNAPIHVSKVVDNTGLQYMRSWTAVADGDDVLESDVWQEFGNGHQGGVSRLASFGDKTSGLVFDNPLHSFILTFGDGTNGFIPPNGARVKTPTVHLATSDTTSYPVTTTASRRSRIHGEYGAIVELEGVSAGTAHLGEYIAGISSLEYCTSSRNIGSVNCPDQTIVNCICCTDSVEDPTYSAVMRGTIGTVEDSLLLRYNPGNDRPGIDVVNGSGYIFKNNILCGNGFRATGCTDILFDNNIVIGERIVVESSPGIILNDTKCMGLLTGQGSYPSLAIHSSEGARVIGFDYLQGRSSSSYGVNSMFQLNSAVDTKIKAIGLVDKPLDLNNIAENALFSADESLLASGVSLERCFFTNSGNTYFSLLEENSARISIINTGEYDTPLVLSTRYQICKGARGDLSASQCRYAAISMYSYGSFFADFFVSDINGQILCKMNEPAPLLGGDLGKATVVAGSPRFTGKGMAYVSNGDILEYEMLYFAIGHTGFDGEITRLDDNQWGGFGSSEWNNTAPEFQYDIGSGWNGTWLDMTVPGNLTSITIDPTVGIKLKLKLTSTGDDILRGFFVKTTATAASQENLYPIDQNERTLTFTGLADDTEVRVYKVSDDTELMGTENTSGGTFSSTFIHPGSDIEVYYHILHIDYRWIRNESFTLTDTDITIPIQQIADTTYKNP